jgi:hypothetical protein
MKTTSKNRIIKVLAASLLMLTSCILLPGSLKASHIVGGEITYEWVSGNTYQVTLSLYRDCAGISLPANATIYYRSDSCSIYMDRTFPMIGTPTQVAPVCASSIPSLTCNGGQLYGVDKAVYQDTITLPAQCEDWKFSYINCCRNAAITNIQSAPTTGFYISAHLDNLNHPFNNSVKFASEPVIVISDAIVSQLNWNTYDVDGDSLVHSLVAAREFSGGQPVSLSYNAGYTFDQPFISSSPTSLNSGSGILTVHPSGMQVSVVGMEVTEYRNGAAIGTVYRDIQVMVTNSTNNNPVLSGINGTTMFITSGCPGDTISFNVNSSDPDAVQNVSISMGANATGGTFTTSGGSLPTGTFTWVPDTTDISASPYIVTLTAIDDNCPYNGTNTYAYYVFVNACNTNDVWPGDANWDGTANLYDLLPIGIAFNETGPVRTGASLAWVAQPAANWNGTFINGLNHKHADTNGDGIVDFADTTAIGQNFGLTHPLRKAPPLSAAAVNLTITPSQDTVPTSTLVDLTVSLDSPGDSIYGLAFRLNFTPGLILQGSVALSYTNSLFGTPGVDMIEMNAVQGGMGYADISITGIDQLNRNSTGPVVVMSIVTTDNVSGKTSYDVFASDIEAIDKNGNPIAIVPAGTIVTVDPNLTSIYESDPAQYFQVFVNNSNALTYTYTGKGNVELIELTDMQGRMLLNSNTNSNYGEFTLNSISSGIYTVRTYINGTAVIKKIRIF